MTKARAGGLDHRLVHFHQCWHWEHGQFSADTTMNLLAVVHPVIEAKPEAKPGIDWRGTAEAG